MSTLQHYGKGIVRVAKNYTKGYSDVQAKVRDATSNDPWGPSGTQMNELAQLTYNQSVLRTLQHEARCRPLCLRRNDFIEIMEMLDKRLNDKGKNWRHVFKVRSRSARIDFQSLYSHICHAVAHRARLSPTRRLGKRGDLLQR